MSEPSCRYVVLMLPESTALLERRMRRMVDTLCDNTQWLKRTAGSYNLLPCKRKSRSRLNKKCTHKDQNYYLVRAKADPYKPSRTCGACTRKEMQRQGLGSEASEDSVQAVFKGCLRRGKCDSPEEAKANAISARSENPKRAWHLAVYHRVCQKYIEPNRESLAQARSARVPGSCPGHGARSVLLHAFALQTAGLCGSV